MRYFKISSFIVSASLLTALFAVSLNAQEFCQRPPADPEMQRVEAMVRQANEERKKFKKAGGKAENENNPAKKWAAALWQYHDEHPTTAAGAKAATNALYLLVLAQRADEVFAKANTLKPDDPAWKTIFLALLEASAIKNDYSFVISKARAILQGSTNKTMRIGAELALGDAYHQRGDLEQAKATFQNLIAQYPSTSIARRAERCIYDIENLSVGKSAPAFTAVSSSGKQISLADLKGKVVLIEFWASWCSLCMADVPLLKAAQEKYKDKGLAIVGISMDESEQAFQDALAQKGITWMQIMDGKSFKGELPDLFNVQGTPTYYILDRDGKIAVKGNDGRVTGEKLLEALAQVIKK